MWLLVRTPESLPRATECVLEDTNTPGSRMKRNRASGTCWNQEYLRFLSLPAPVKMLKQLGLTSITF